MNMTPSEKVGRFTTGIFSELAARKQDAMKRGMDVIDLSVGSPDLPPPDFVSGYACEVCAGSQFLRVYVKRYA